MAKIETNQAVYKYELQVIDEQQIDLPIGAQILRVDIQHGAPMLWAAIDPMVATERRTIYCIGTGHRFRGASSEHIGTVQLSGGSLVFHYFIQ